MAEPALKFATEFVRLAVADFDMSWVPSVEVTLDKMDLSLPDLPNALSSCEVQRSNKSEADGVLLHVIGFTTDDVELQIQVWVSMDQRLYRVEKVS